MMDEPQENRGGGPYASEFNDQAAFALWDRLYVLRRRWWLLVFFAALAGGLAYWKISNAVPVYQAEATVQKKEERSPLSPTVTSARPDLLSEIEIVRSTAVLAPVVSEMKPTLTTSAQEDEVNSLRRAVLVSQLPGTNLIRISYRHPDPQYAADLVNRVASSYQLLSASKSREEAIRRKDFVASQLAQVTDSLRAAQELLASYQRSSGTLNPSDRGDAVASALIEAETEVRTLRYQEGLLQTIMNGLRSANSSDDALRRAVVLGRDIVPGITELYNRLQANELEKSRLTAGRFGETRQGATVQVLDSLIATTKQDVRAMTEQSQAALRSRLDAALARVGDLQSQQGALPQQASDFTRLQQRADAVQRTFDQLTSSYYEAQVAEAVQGGQIEIVDNASIPRQAAQASDPRLLLFAILAGIALGSVIAFMLEFLDRKVRTPKDAEEASDLKLLGSIPRVKKDSTGTGLIMATDDQNAASEAFRMLRTSLHFARADRPQVIAITSAGPGEGKSLIACNLALAIARQGLRVLLIDADLRRPTVHKVFDVRNGSGLSDVLVGDFDLMNVLSSSPAPTLSLLVSGTIPPNPAELLTGSRFTELMSRVRDEFDLAIIDTPPVLAVTDATALADFVDGVILVCRAEFSERHAVNHAAKQLRHVGAPLLGVVLNAVPGIGRYGRYGAHYGYYGYSYTEYYRSESKQKTRFLSRK